MQLAIIYQDENIVVVDKPAGISVFPEGGGQGKTAIDLLSQQFPKLHFVGKAPRYGIVHRLDKDTSGVLLVAKNERTLQLLQKQFMEGEVEKKYLALVVGNVKKENGIVETFLGRSPKDRRRQKVYREGEPAGKAQLRRAITEYKVLRRFKNFALLEIVTHTGRKHQIRTHMAYLHHPIAGDKLYGFKNQPHPPGLKRQFLHAISLSITLPEGKRKTFSSPLPKDLKMVLSQLGKT